MATSSLPERASLEFLKKLAKERLRELRAGDPAVKLATAQLALAREYGFASWRQLKAEVERRQASSADAVFEACLAGDAAALGRLLDSGPELVRARKHGLGVLHAAAASVECVRLLLERGADPDARDEGDSASPLHHAAAHGNVDVVRALLDAGADVHGRGDVHGGDVIGWAVGNGKDRKDFNPAVVALLLERGARHHIFSAIAMDDPDLVRSIVAEDPEALRRRRSRFEESQSPLHFALAAPNAIARKTPQYDMARLLIQLGADVEATDDLGRTPLAVAMLRGDVEAMRLLEAAGARPPATAGPRSEASLLRESMYRQVTPMLCVEDPDATVALYTSLGFTLDARVPEVGRISWAAMSFGKAHLMVQERVARPANMIALWFHTSRIEELYELFKARQLDAARQELAQEPASAPGAGPGPGPAFRFEEDLYSPHYGGRQFSVSDPNGFELVFQSE